MNIALHFNPERLYRMLKSKHAIIFFIVLVSCLLLRQMYEIYIVFAGSYGAETKPITMHNTFNPQTIIQAHLFGQAEQMTLMPSSLNLKLTGIVASSEKNNSYAVIVDESGVEKVYHVGQQIGSAIVEKIKPHEVILNVDGHLEFLKLPEVKNV